MLPLFHFPSLPLLHSAALIGFFFLSSLFDVAQHKAENCARKHTWTNTDRFACRVHLTHLAPAENALFKMKASHEQI